MPVSSDLYLHIPYKVWTDNPLKRILVNTRGFCTKQVEVKSLYIRTKISINRKGLKAFAVFLLSIFAGIRYKAVSGIGCRSPPLNLDFQKNSDWR